MDEGIQTKEAATDMFSLQPPRHISTLSAFDAPVLRHDTEILPLACKPRSIVGRFGTGAAPASPIMVGARPFETPAAKPYPNSRRCWHLVLSPGEPCAISNAPI